MIEIVPRATIPTATRRSCEGLHKLRAMKAEDRSWMTMCDVVEADIVARLGMTSDVMTRKQKITCLCDAR